MKKRFSDEQIISILHAAEAGISARELRRKHAISDATFYTWRNKYGGLEVPEVNRCLRDFRRASYAFSGQHCAVSRLPGYDKNRSGAGIYLQRAGSMSL